MGKALLIVNPDSGRRDGAVFAQDATFVNGVSFAHTVTGGTLPEGIREVSSDVKTRFGLSAYAASELLRVGNDRRYRLCIVADGEEIAEGIGSLDARLRYTPNCMAQ